MARPNREKSINSVNDLMGKNRPNCVFDKNNYISILNHSNINENILKYGGKYEVMFSR